MNTTGPTPIANVYRIDDAGMALRLNQRITAEVLQVAGDQVQLVLDGVRVVGRLTTPDQAAVLAERRTAQFIVRGRSKGVLRLQLVSAGGGNPDTAVTAPLDLAPALLEHLGIPTEARNLILARALLAQGLPVTEETLERLRQALEALGEWGAAEAEAAAGLQAAGLPPTRGSIRLVLREPVTLAAALGALLGGLDQRARRDASLRGRAAARWADWLRGLLLPMDRSPLELSRRLRTLLSAFGRPPEGELARLARGQQGGELLELVRWAQEGARESGGDLGRAIDDLLDGLRRMHLPNLQRVDDAGRRWVRFELPVLPTPNQKPQHGSAPRPAYVRARMEGAEGEEGPGRLARLRLTMEVLPGRALEVDLAFAGERVGVHVLAGDPELQLAATEALAGLRQGLQGLGYEVHHLRAHLGSPEEPDPLTPIAAKRELTEVNVEA